MELHKDSGRQRGGEWLGGTAEQTEGAVKRQARTEYPRTQEWGSCLPQMKRRIEKSERAEVVQNGCLRRWMGPETRLKPAALRVRPSHRGSSSEHSRGCLAC